MKQDLRAKPAGLLASPVRQFRAADSVRETQVVLDGGAGAGLTAHGRSFDQDGLQSLRRSIDRGAETGGARTIDADVVFGSRRIAEPTKLLSDLPNGRTLQPRPVGEETNRQARIVQAGDLRVAACLLIRVQLDPLKRHIAAIEKVAYRIRCRRSARPAEFYGRVRP